MKTMNLDQFKSALEKAGRVKGADGVSLQKKLILENYMITDAEGVMVDPDSLDVTISAAQAEPTRESVRSRACCHPKFQSRAVRPASPRERQRAAAQVRSAGSQARPRAQRPASVRSPARQAAGPEQAPKRAMRWGKTKAAATGSGAAGVPWWRAGPRRARGRAPAQPPGA